MKCIKTEDAVGHVLCHDMTQIIPGVSKGPRFRKGHIVTAEDIPVLLSMGKEQLYVWELQPGFLHENDAAERLCALCQNANMRKSDTKEGKIELSADIDGVFLVDTERLNAVNSIDEIMIATRRGNGIVHPGDKLCGTRVIPLIIVPAIITRHSLINPCYWQEDDAAVKISLHLSFLYIIIHPEEFSQ